MHNNGWHAYTKPSSFYFGNGSAPYFTGPHWTSWGSKSAWATGRLWTQKPGCSPSYKCAYSSRWVGVYLNTVRTHGAARYYARMAIEFKNGGKMHWVVGRFGIHGGTVPWWQFPAVFPYLQLNQFLTRPDMLARFSCNRLVSGRMMRSDALARRTRRPGRRLRPRVDRPLEP